jgi:hypothetical protein
MALIIKLNPFPLAGTAELVQTSVVGDAIQPRTQARIPIESRKSPKGFQIRLLKDIVHQVPVSK